mmetsp:Transcript_1834/g.5553  ORF Transcript_1834/g.5553 Transcript_1834/m.5553 type:complete len:81 (+) Transcript_1834:462-704(+)
MISEALSIGHLRAIMSYELFAVKSQRVKHFLREAQAKHGLIALTGEASSDASRIPLRELDKCVEFVEKELSRHSASVRTE